MDTHSSDCIAAAVAQLESARSLLTEEIRTYPAPVSGCDEQYNHLLVERRRVSNALHALAEPLRVPTPRVP